MTNGNKVADVFWSWLQFDQRRSGWQGTTTGNLARLGRFCNWDCYLIFDGRPGF